MSGHNCEKETGARRGHWPIVILASMSLVGLASRGAEAQAARVVTFVCGSEPAAVLTASSSAGAPAVTPGTGCAQAMADVLSIPPGDDESRWEVLASAVSVKHDKERVTYFEAAFPITHSGPFGSGQWKVGVGLNYPVFDFYDLEDGFELIPVTLTIWAICV